jgi:1-acyl-sn-glycerol-3-phosphate acyltransferase
MSGKVPSRPGFFDRTALETDVHDTHMIVLFYLRRIAFSVFYFLFLGFVAAYFLSSILFEHLTRENGPLPKFALVIKEQVSRIIWKYQGARLYSWIGKAVIYAAIISLLLFPLDFISLGTLALILIFSASATVLLFNISPWTFFRTANRIFIKSVYQLHSRGELNIPSKGPALLICNHISFVDFCIMARLSSRPLVYVMDNGLYSIPLVNFFVARGKAIPIDNYKHPEIKEAAFNAIKKHLDDGELVAVFPEGQVSYDGKMAAFKKGILRVQKDNPRIPLIPITITGLEGGFFSRAGQLFKPSKLRFELFRHVSVTVGEPIKANSLTLTELENKVRTQLTDTMEWHHSFLAQSSKKVPHHEKAS